LLGSSLQQEWTDQIHKQREERISLDIDGCEWEEAVTAETEDWSKRFPTATTMTFNAMSPIQEFEWELFHMLTVCTSPFLWPWWQQIITILVIVNWITTDTVFCSRWNRTVSISSLRHRATITTNGKQTPHKLVKKQCMDSADGSRSTLISPFLLHSFEQTGTFLIIVNRTTAETNPVYCSR
jgi:hypothetical protein